LYFIFQRERERESDVTAWIVGTVTTVRGNSEHMNNKFVKLKYMYLIIDFSLLMGIILLAFILYCCKKKSPLLRISSNYDLLSVTEVEMSYLNENKKVFV